MAKGGNRKGAGRPATGLKDTVPISIRVSPKLKARVEKKVGKSLKSYIVGLIEEDLKKDS